MTDFDFKKKKRSGTTNEKKKSRRLFKGKHRRTSKRGLSIAAQREKLTHYAFANDWDIVDFILMTVSAGKT